ncbi:Gfo/Idh/MocA family oxidoreductase [Umezawaea sp. Da 62-37]|uniref:Gfo/Idh/MocA family oxidoreductase n=1 Tax=Umezawaea sp. Da 62-37 TaxID=3075927 RepID=UPI0028F74CAE|nr:Gfo/Idh/MocA family oxidoreductase [Umezawaea sp. Da 62-37]WNV90503.1 Gfo/Idh/MocA family oxidoreductase [Umezawaea sp. Da 62-37]
MRTALIGYGLGGSAFHAPFVHTTPGLELSAVVTGDPGRQAEVRARYPEAEILPSIDDVWAGDYDLAVVTTPNRFHHAHARSALEHGLHVVVDKPFSGTAAEARALVDFAAAQGLVVVPFHNRRWDGDFRTVQKLLADGALGDVHRFESRFERWRPAVKSTWKESGDPADLGSIVFDLGTHLVDQSIALFGPPVEVYAEIATLRAGAQADDDAFLSLTHRDGTRSHLHMGALVADLGPRFRVLGDKAAYVKCGMDPQEDLLKAGTTPGGDGWGEEPESAWGELRAGGESSPVRTEPGAYQLFYAGVAKAVLHGDAPPVDARDAVSGLEVIEAAAESARTRQVVVLA